MRRLLSGLAILAFLIGAAAVTTDRVTELLPLDFPSPSTSQTPQRASIIEAVDSQDVSAAIQQVIQRSNDQQSQAIATREPSMMADTVTAGHYEELVQINQNLLDSGVTAIALNKLDWGAIAVDGASATATTFESWTTTYADGTTRRSLLERNDYMLVLDNGNWKIESDVHPGQAPTARTPPPQTIPGIPDNQNTSHNWSGYAATGGAYTAVSGTWTVPQFDSAEVFGIDAAWVGIGGVRSRDLIQAGTQQTVNGNGRTQYEAWIEMLPRPSRPIPFRVHPGDSITVSLSEQSTNQWLIEFTNNTTGQSYRETQTYQSTHSSAEWVEEAPSGGRGGVLPLSNFGSIDFTAGWTVKNGQKVNIAGSGARAITMVSPNSQALAIPSVLGSDGASFTVERTDVPATTASPRGRGFFAPAPVPNDTAGS